MRRTVLSSLVALMVAALALGCSESPVDSATDVSATSSDISSSMGKIGDAPASSGVVVRGEGPSFTVFTWIDSKEGTRVTIAADMADFCAGDPVDWDFLHFQTVFRLERLVTRIQEDNRTTSVWPFTDFDCDLFTTVEPLATGYSDFLRIDNDFCRDDPRCDFTGGNNAKAWGMHAQGHLTRPSGDGAVFSGHFRGLNSSTVTSKITLK